ncbi:tRNA methyltransferase 10 homolog A [Ischnura elegans]|uniref:tRNA methyltransferase 10 homolog A n=1 Tax=Ischnura elegans TaxID=197161 RepID=UPI001ED8A07B|nr:tRNA methyltransferase 10 homolog A [Ischnura elegans]
MEEDDACKSTSDDKTNDMHSELENSAETDSQVNDRSPHLADGLSKKQRKRLLRREKWLEVRKLKRAKEKQRLKEKKKIAQENNVTLGPSRKKLKCNKMSGSKCKVRVVIDLSFNDIMNDKDIGKCVKQIHHCYSVNRRYSDPMQLYLTSFSGRLEKDMEKHDGFRNWDVNFSSEHFTELFKPSELVYLTSDSENVLTTLEEEKVYIIGGLVDHNSQKGLCLKVANDVGISHGQLPIGEFIQMASRKTLTIDHVFEIMHGVCHGKTWEEALLQVIPPRKGAQVKNKSILEDTESPRSPEEGASTGSKSSIVSNEEESKVSVPGLNSLDSDDKHFDIENGEGS